MKNKTLKIACGLLVMVLLTTCVIGTTLARYTTSSGASDDARVAKWGVEVNASGTLFGDSYAQVGDGNSITTYNHANSTVVAEADGTGVVAPGTRNLTGFRISVSGTPEVDFQILTTASTSNEDIYLKAGKYGMMVEQYGLNAASDVSALYTFEGGVYTLATSATWDSAKTYYRLQDALDLAADYYPINWTVANTGDATAIALTKNIATIGTAIETALDGIGVQTANNPSDASYTITWEWQFDTNSAADTILGNLIAGKTNIVVYDSVNSNYCPITVSDNVATGNSETVANLDVTFGFDITVEQVD